MIRFACAFFAVLSACTPFGSHAGCLGDWNCAKGEICVHEHAHDGNWDACFVPCLADSTCPAGTARQSCPDSPDGTACTRDDGRTKACYCG